MFIVYIYSETFFSRLNSTMITRFELHKKNLQNMGSPITNCFDFLEIISGLGNFCAKIFATNGAIDFSKHFVTTMHAYVWIFEEG